MGYVPGFEYDLFISYDRQDNEPDSQNIRWVRELHRHLTFGLTQHLGQEAQIFLDYHDFPTDEIKELVLKAARDSAIFLAVLSPSYVARDRWTLKELSAFSAGKNSGQRIVPIELLPIEKADYPPQIRDLKRTLFYERDGETDTPRRLTPTSNSDAYIKRLDFLTHEFAKLLRDMRASSIVGETPGQIDSRYDLHDLNVPPGPDKGDSAFDVFISYPHQDKASADAACATLEAAKIRCWIAPRDITPGVEWAEAIVGAIGLCRVMVLIFSSSANKSKQIRREVQQAFDKGLPVVPMRMENVQPTETLGYYMGPVHWLDAMTPPLEQHLQRLTESVQALLHVAARN
jgi:hypothetical protein